MTSHAMVTIIAPIPLTRVEAVRQRIGDELANPANTDFRNAVAPADKEPFLHFASLHAIAGSAGDKGYLVLEFSADGSPQSAIDHLADRVGHRFSSIFAEAEGFATGDDIAAYWRKNMVTPGFGIGDEPGLAFSGTPGLSVSDIHREKALTDHVAGILKGQPPMPPLERIDDVRDRLKGTEWAWALDTPPPAPSRPESATGVLSGIAALAWPFVINFGWPLLVAALLLALLLNWPAQWVWHDAGALHDGWTFALLVRTTGQVLGFVAGTLGLVLLIVLLAAGTIYACFRRSEASDWLSDRSADENELQAIFARENDPHHVQNHMVSHTVRKPGWLRRLTSRLAFFIIAGLTVCNPRQGFLGDIGTIHFARWITIPGTRDMLFFSNYGGSWESYLEDFITKAHAGLTAVWSNTTGFPRTRNLFQDGATDGERFKRYARQSMIRTPFWYCAYPQLTTANIRDNRLVRRGLAAAVGEAEAVEWLAVFGSRPRPRDKLESSQMQSLLFGGMGFKPDGKLMLLDLSDDVDCNRALLAELMPYIAFGDGRYYVEPALVTCAPSARGLAKLGLPQDALATFPHAFRAGMSDPGRARLLGDIGSNAPHLWRWGGEGHDIALLVYGNALAEDEAVSQIDLLDIVIAESCERLGAAIVHRVDLTPVAGKAADRIEPFGFVDGVSQPAMRGTYRGLRNADPIHLVEPGEFVLGYPDNRGNIPPGPFMDARHDPAMHLAVAGEAQGFAETRAEKPRLPAYNGSFLVIRQLEQDVPAFTAFCEEQGELLREAFPDIPVTACMADFVGAKMIGRWKDGSSLVRNPYISASELKEKTGRDSGQGTSRPESEPADAHAKPIEAAEPTDLSAEADPALSGGTRHSPMVSARTGERPAIRPDNDFLFGTEDPQGLRCPFGSHIRRTNPRDSLSPGSDDQIAITNRHRILRVGRGYLAENGRDTAGLMFMCLNADLERQFEFVQQTWMQSVKFHGLDAEADPIAVNGHESQRGFTIPTRRGPVTLGKLPQFVTVRGGGYFFVPGKQLLEFLAADDPALPSRSTRLRKAGPASS